MEPFTFGIVFVSVSGAVLVFITILESVGFKINELAVKLALETTKFGAILWFLYKLYSVFFF